MKDGEILIGSNNRIKIIENITDEIIAKEAVNQIKSMKHTLPNKVLDSKNTESKKSILL